MSQHYPRPEMSLTPYVIEDTGRGERSMDIYSRLLKDRIIFIGTEITDHVASAIVKGTSKIEASVLAIKVLPEPVGPKSKTLDLLNSTLEGSLLLERIRL